jgi:hypothetical protein
MQFNAGQVQRARFTEIACAGAHHLNPATGTRGN